MELLISCVRFGEAFSLMFRALEANLVLEELTLLHLEFHWDRWFSYKRRLRAKSLTFVFQGKPVETEQAIQQHVQILSREIPKL